MKERKEEKRDKKTREVSGMPRKSKREREMR